MKRFFLSLSFVILCLALWYYLTPHQQMPVQTKKTVALNMIVKNEKEVIERCLESVLPFINYWVIVDTGSTDGTQEVIKTFMKKKGIPGELFERPWVNFSHNRNEALQLARPKADYIFITDADEYLVYEPGFTPPALDKDYYYMTLTSGGTKWSKIQLINTKHDWKYEGVLHEVLCPTTDQSVATLEKVHNVYTSDGARSKDPQKYEKDASILEAALKDDPTNSRYQFYLAESYANSNNYEKAVEAYLKRASMMTGYNEERFVALIKAGSLKEFLNQPQDEIVDCYTRAISVNRKRIEPYHYLANYYRKLDDFEKAYKIASIGVQIPRSDDLLFAQTWMHDYGMLLELSIAAYWIGEYEECQKASLQLLERPLPQNVRECVEQNLGFANEKLLEAALEPSLLAG
jgi:glycosyltransferase involved in cell wall biosynthesis